MPGPARLLWASCVGCTRSHNYSVVPHSCKTHFPHGHRVSAAATQFCVTVTGDGNEGTGLGANKALFIWQALFNLSVVCSSKRRDLQAPSSSDLILLYFHFPNTPWTFPSTLPCKLFFLNVPSTFPYRWTSSNRKPKNHPKNSPKTENKKKPQTRSKKNTSPVNSSQLYFQEEVGIFFLYSHGTLLHFYYISRYQFSWLLNIFASFSSPSRKQ